MCEYTATLTTESLPSTKIRALLYRKPESKLQDAAFLTHFVELTNVQTSLSCSTECFSGPLQAAPQNIYVAADGDASLQRWPRICRVTDTCANTLGLRGPFSTSEVFSSHIHLQNGTFPGSRRRLPFAPSRRTSAQASGELRWTSCPNPMTASLVDVSRLTSAASCHDALPRCSKLIPRWRRGRRGPLPVKHQVVVAALATRESRYWRLCVTCKVSRLNQRCLGMGEVC